MRWILCLLVGSITLTACGEDDVPRLDVFHYVILASGLTVREGVAAGEEVDPEIAFVIDSTTTEPGDRWVMAEVQSGQTGRYRLYRLTGDYGLWLLTNDGRFYCANDLACTVSIFPPTTAQPTQAQLQELASALYDAHGFQLLP